MQLWTMKLLLSNNFGNKQTEKPTTSLTVSFYVLPLWYRHYLLNYHGLNSHYLECCHHSAWEKRTLKAQAQQIFRWKEMHIIYSLDSPLVLVTWPNSCAEKRGKPDTGEKHKRYRMCVHAQSCLTLCNSRDCGPPGSSVHGIFQARILEWVAISYCRESSWPRDWNCITCISCITANSSPTEPLGKPSKYKKDKEFIELLMDLFFS